MTIHFWENYPKLYDLLQILITGGFLNRAIKEIKFAKNKRILELGCGTGTLSQYLNCKSYLGVDINPNFIRLASAKFPEHKFKVSNIITSKLPMGNFDYVITMNVLHHLTDNELIKLFKKIKNSASIKNFIIIEGKPVGILSPILKKLDAGSNFREFGFLEKLIKDYFTLKKVTKIKSGYGIYQYFITSISIND